jgi:hypothetical protein
MAAEEGAVIACHTNQEFDAHMAKGKETGKLVRARDSRSRPRFDSFPVEFLVFVGSRIVIPGSSQH